MSRERRQDHGQSDHEDTRDDSLSRGYFYPSRGRSPPSPLEWEDAPPFGRQELADPQQSNVQAPAEDDLIIRTADSGLCNLPSDGIRLHKLAQVAGEQMIAQPHMCPEGNECDRFKCLKTIVALINQGEDQDGMRLDASEIQERLDLLYRPDSAPADQSGPDKNQPREPSSSSSRHNTETHRSHTLLDTSKPQIISLIPYTEGGPVPSLDFNTIQRIWLPGSSPITIGRYSTTNLPSNDPLIPDSIGFKSQVVSRRHCEVIMQDGRWYIRDVGSASGTFLNHIRISPPRRDSDLMALQSGDTVQLGINLGLGEEDIFRCVRMKIGYETVEESFTTEDLTSMTTIHGRLGQATNE